MGQGHLREPVQRLIVQDPRLWWKSRTLAYFQESFWTSGLYLVLNLYHIFILYYFKILLITVLHSVPCLVCHLATLLSLEIMVLSKTDQWRNLRRRRIDSDKGNPNY